MFAIIRKEPEKPRSTRVLNISCVQLAMLMGEMAEVAERDVREDNYLFDPEILFEFRGTMHRAGARYDIRREAFDGKRGYRRKYLTFFVDNESDSLLTRCYERALIGGIPLKRIRKGILVHPLYRRFL